MGSLVFYQVHYHSPPRFPMEAIAEIRSGATALFKQLGLRDFARVDGWLLPPSTTISLGSHGQDKSRKLLGQFDAGTVIFSDINLVCYEPEGALFSRTSGYLKNNVNVCRTSFLISRLTDTSRPTSKR